MKLLLLVAACLVGLGQTASFGQYSSRPAGVLHQYPLSAAREVSCRTTVGMRLAEPLDQRVSQTCTLLGSISGRHEATVRISTDGLVVNFEPTTPFAAGEQVAVEARLLTQAGRSINNAFSFTTMRRALGAQSSAETSYAVVAPSRAVAKAKSAKYPQPMGISIGALPNMVVAVDDNAMPGSIFIANAGASSPPADPCLIILNEHGALRKTHFLPTGDKAYDFKLQPNGLLTYYSKLGEKYYGMNSSWAIVDSFEAANDYATDLHELMVLPNGTYTLMATAHTLVDMRDLVTGGDSSADVESQIIQVFGPDHLLQFEWRGLDHYQITDADHINLKARKIDFQHANALDLDAEGNILISNRHLSEVTKINGTTGDIIWRLGGRNNQFALIGDSIWFSYQHDARKLANGHLTLFDDSNYDSVLNVPGYIRKTRALEYVIDETNKTATLVWQFHHNPDIFSQFMGNVQRLPNGNTLIGWGGHSITMTEARPDGTTAFELKMPSFPTSLGDYSYRSFKFSSTVQPTLFAPLTGARFAPDTRPVELSWIALLETPSYQVQISVGNQKVLDTIVSKTTFHYLPKLERTAYSWRVRAADTTKPWSQSWTFNTDPFDVISPSVTIDKTIPYKTKVKFRDNLVRDEGIRDVSWSWKGDPQANYSKLFRVTPDQFASCTHNTVSVVIEQLDTLTGGEFELRAHDCAGNEVVTTATIEAHLYCPEQLLPTNGKVGEPGVALDFAWTGVPEMVRYHVQIYDPNAIVLDTVLTENQLTFTPIEEWRTYKWRVRGLYAEYPGPWSIYHDFSTIGYDTNAPLFSVDSSMPFVTTVTIADNRTKDKGVRSVSWSWVDSLHTNANQIQVTTQFVPGDSCTQAPVAVWLTQKDSLKAGAYQINASDCSGNSGSVRIGFSAHKFNPDPPPLAVRGSSIRNAIVSISPNPSRDRASIEIELAQGGLVSLTLYDMLGKARMVVDAGSLVSGPHTLPLDTRELAVGSYYLRLQTGKEILTKKLEVRR